jgi:hypothetical protein
VHSYGCSSGSPVETEASQLQSPRSEPDEQPPESSHLDLNRSEPIPTDRRHLHFGNGQTETQLDLTPGKHTLQLVLGDAEHKVFDPPVISDKITVTVLDPNAVARKPATHKRATLKKRKRTAGRQG